MHHDAGIQYVAPLESFPLDKWDAILGPFRWKRCDGTLVCATESGSHSSTTKPTSIAPSAQLKPIRLIRASVIGRHVEFCGTFPKEQPPF
jgi:hypothetical protein